MTLTPLVSSFATANGLQRWGRGTIVTPGTTPGAATNVAGSAPSPTTAVLSWGPPSVTGGSAITGYVVSVSGSAAVTVDDVTRSFTFTGLTASTGYTLSVTPQNDVGSGPATTVTVATPPVTGTVPGAATAVTATSSAATSASLSWGPPANDGGSAITAYIVARAGGPTVTLAATARRYAFGGLTASTAYTLSVTPVNAVGSGPSSSRTVTTKPTGVTGERFPGDPNPMANGGRLYWGLSADNNPSFTTFSQFETAIGQKVGVHHFYDNGLGMPSVAVPDATHPTRKGIHIVTALADLDAGRLPLASTFVSPSQWQAAGNGTFDANGVWTPNPGGGLYDAEIYAFIDWCEGSAGGVPNLSGPFWWVVNHEPDAGNGGKGDGNPLYYRSWMNRIRWNLTRWENANGPRKRLVFLTCHTAFMWAKGTAIGDLGIGDWWPGDNVPDVVGVDCYAEHNGPTVVNVATDSITNSGNFKKFHSFVTARNLTWALTEWGVLPLNTNGYQVIKDAYSYCTDGTQDCVLMSYFNSGWWHLTDDNGTLSEAKSEAKNAKSIHLSDLGY